MQLGDASTVFKYYRKSYIWSLLHKMTNFTGICFFEYSYFCTNRTFFFFYYHFQDMLHFVDYAWIPSCFLLCILHAICSKIVGSSNEFSQILFLFINLWRTFPWRLVSYGRYRSDLYLEFPRQSPLSFKTR